jgi:dihydroflavonol-4-reductase
MKVLVLGGTGPIGGHAALHLAEHGHAVTIGARKPAAPTTAMSKMKFLAGDYVEGGFTKAELGNFDALVFAAGQDPRHLAKGDDGAAWWEKSNIKAVPALFARAKEAGVKHAINIGSFYPQVRASLVDSNPYVRSRHLSDQGIRALASPTFNALSLNAPYVMGTVPGLEVPYLNLYVQYAQGKKKTPVFAPTGGVNFISTLSLAEAVAGALARGKGGTAYLVGDQNLSFRDFFQMFFDAAGSGVTVPEKAEDHPYIGNYAGLGQTLYFEPDAAETALLGYRRNDVQRAIEDAVKQYPTA